MQRLPDQYARLDAQLRKEGLCIVPLTPTPAMKGAAADAMRRRQADMGEDWFAVSNKEKAGLRWTAMLEAWRLAKPETA